MKECVCSVLLNRWFIGSQGIVGNSSSNSSNRMGTVCVGEREVGRQTEREADGCLTVESTDSPLTVLSLWLSAD